MEDVRSLPVNRRHWFAVAPAQQLRRAPLAVELWGEQIVLFRDATGQVHALEDRCPHRQVRLSHGRIVGGELECAYHGWRFGSGGECTWAPYGGDALRGCRVGTWPVVERDGFLWVWGGAPELAHAVQPLALPEWDHLNYIATVSEIVCQAHFSYLVENLMDMHHGHLHQSFQAWGAARLEALQENEQTVSALYTAESYYRIDRIWSIAQLFVPALRQPHPERLEVDYVYPHWRSRLGEDFRIYCLLCPPQAGATRAFLVHFTSLEAFDKLHQLPVPFRRFVKNSLFGSAQFLLDGLVRQDVRMIEEEQRAHDSAPHRRNWEPNPALAAVQRLIRRQARDDATAGYV